MTRALRLRAFGAAVVLALIAVFAAYVVARLQTTPSISTDLPYYLPYSTVHMTGGGMDPGVRYEIVTIRPDGSVVSGDAAHNPIPPAPYDSAVADASGNFAYDYLLTNVQGFYTVNVYKSSDTAHTTLIASTIFEDALSPNMDQCANGAPPFGDFHCDWQNGNLNGSNSSYLEGQVIPFRYTIDGFSGTGTHTFHLNYDFSSDSGAKGYDFLTAYNVTQTGADPCSGSAAAP